MVPDVGSDMIHMNHTVDSTGEADSSKSQLNLALEKSISGCWAMNLQTDEHSLQVVTKARHNHTFDFLIQYNFIIVLHIFTVFTDTADLIALV